MAGAELLRSVPEEERRSPAFKAEEAHIRDAIQRSLEMNVGDLEINVSESSDSPVWASLQHYGVIDLWRKVAAGELSNKEYLELNNIIADAAKILEIRKANLAQPVELDLNFNATEEDSMQEDEPEEDEPECNCNCARCDLAPDIHCHNERTGCYL